jgi:hypothetical protein
MLAAVGWCAFGDSSSQPSPDLATVASAISALQLSSGVRRDVKMTATYGGAEVLAIVASFPGPSPQGVRSPDALREPLM